MVWLQNDWKQYTQVFRRKIDLLAFSEQITK